MARLTLILACLALLPACKSGQTETRTIFKTDKVIQTRIDTLRVADSRQADKRAVTKVDEWRRHVDSSAVKDTVRVIINANGSTDTERVRYITRYIGNTRELSALQSSVERYRDSVDVFRAKCDSLTRVKNDVRKVEKVRTEGAKWWQRLLLWLGFVALFAVGYHKYLK